MGSGVEWALHLYLLLVWAEDSRPLRVAELAAAYDLPRPYLTKHLQALVRANLLRSTPGPQGGYSLERSPEDTTVLDVVKAIEGDGQFFRCTDIRKQGELGTGQAPGCDGRRQSMCLIHRMMLDAELAWRQTLADQTMADLAAQVSTGVPGVDDRVRGWMSSGRG